MTTNIPELLDVRTLTAIHRDHKDVLFEWFFAEPGSGAVGDVLRETAGRACRRFREEHVVPAPAAVHAPQPRRSEQARVELEREAD